MPMRKYVGFEELECLKAEYEKLRKKYNLPQFEELDEEFEIRKVDYDLFLIREIRRLVLSKLDFVASLLEPILDPGKSLHSMIETKFFEKYNIELMFDFYKKLWKIIHEGISASLTSEKAEAEFIKDVWKQWPEIKKQSIEYADKIAAGWGKVEKEVFADKYLQ